MLKMISYVIFSGSLAPQWPQGLEFSATWIRTSQSQIAGGHFTPSLVQKMTCLEEPTCFIVLDPQRIPCKTWSWWFELFQPANINQLGEPQTVSLRPCCATFPVLVATAEKADHANHHPNPRQGTVENELAASQWWGGLLPLVIADDLLLK